MALINPQDALVVGSPEWWLIRLVGKLSARRGGLDTLDAYYEGNQQIKYAMERWRKAFARQFRQFSENVCPLVVDSVEERIDIVGFQVGGKFDDATWSMWQRNRMDAESQIAHFESLLLASSYALVWNEDANAGRAQITVESPHEMIVEHVAGSRWLRAAALKVWQDDASGKLNATLYLPDALYKFETVRSVDESTRPEQIAPNGWQQRLVDGEEIPLANPFGVVPVVPLYNRPRLRKPPRSEIADVLTSQDAINKLTMDMLVASEFAAFRQRYLIGVEEPRDPETGQVISDYWKQALEAFLIVPNAEAKVGSIDATDLGNYVLAIEHEIQQVATRTKTPPHYFFLRGQFPSGESIVAAEAGLVSKAMRRQRHWADSWEEVITLARQIEGLPGSSGPRQRPVDTMWRDPESRTEAQHIDAVGKKRQMLGVPQEQAWEDAGYTPTQIERMRKMRDAEAAAGIPAATPAPTSDGSQGAAAGQ